MGTVMWSILAGMGGDGPLGMGTEDMGLGTKNGYGDKLG